MQRLETAADSGVLEFLAKYKTERPGSSNSVERHSPTLRSHARNFSVSFNSTVEEKKSGHEFYLELFRSIVNGASKWSQTDAWKFQDLELCDCALSIVVRMSFLW